MKPEELEYVIKLNRKKKEEQLANKSEGKLGKVSKRRGVAPVILQNKPAPHPIYPKTFPKFEPVTNSNIRLEEGRIIMVDRDIQTQPIKEDRVMVTGHLGHLGKPTTELLGDTYDIVGYDIKEHNDLLNLSNLVYKMNGCAFVVHCAGIPHPNSRYDFPDYFTQNVIGTLNVCKAAELLKVKRVVYLSSGGLLGWDTEGRFTPDYFPIDEAHIPASVSGHYTGKLSGYGMSKFLCEQILAWYATNGKFQVVCLRLAPALTNGLDSMKDGKYLPDRNKTFWTNTLPTTCAKAVKKALTAEINSPFEIINVVEKEIVVTGVDIEKYLKEQWEGVELRDWKAPMSLMDTKKAEKLLNLYDESEE